MRDSLPDLRGKWREKADLGKVTWFGVGGAADFLFRPEDVADLQYFMQHKPETIPVMVLGLGSNILVRDGGIEGVVIRLGRGFTHCTLQEDRLMIGAGCINANAVLFAETNGLGGLEFLSGIPGNIGGALAMNAGAYGSEVKDILLSAELMDEKGNLHILSAKELHFTYRQCAIPKGWIFTSATFQGKQESRAIIAERIAAISHSRQSTQPIRSKTGGSTFKNPLPHKAWELIDQAGCRGLMIGDAQISELHCNFMINKGNATAAELENLGNEVIRRVYEQCGITLEWEIKRVGRR